MTEFEKSDFEKLCDILLVNIEKKLSTYQAAVERDKAFLDKLDKQSQILKIMRQCLRINNDEQEFLEDFNSRIQFMIDSEKKEAF